MTTHSIISMKKWAAVLGLGLAAILGSLSRRGSRRLLPLAILLALTAAPSVVLADQSDAWITMKSKIALITADEVNAAKINVDTIQGIVTLHGIVRSEKEKKRAEEVVRKTKGVRGVQNLLQVMSKKEQKAVEKADERIEEDVEKALHSYPFDKKTDISVHSVHNGTVLLAGKVTTVTELLNALEIAESLPGVRKVASEVEVPLRVADAELWREKTEAVAPPAKTSDWPLTDLRITTAIKMKYVGDERVPALAVNVDTRQGVVTLFGSVPSEEAKRGAEELAKEVDGVTQVVNALHVVPENDQKVVAARDEEIEGQVKQRIEGDPRLKEQEIAVEVENGLVRLSGTVATQSDRITAVFLARAVDGVHSVKNDLKVEGANARDLEGGPSARN